MHAVLVSVTIEGGKMEDARRMLTADIVPMVKAAEGFVAGYWLEPEGDKGWSTAPPVGSRPGGAPVVVEHVEFRQVIASA